MIEADKVRRYYLSERLMARARGETALEGVWRWKQELREGDPLPDDFPLVAELALIGYSTFQDLIGAELREMQNAGMTIREAITVLDEVQYLIAQDELAEEESA